MNAPVETLNSQTRILIVDDQAGMRLTLGGILRKRGYQTVMVEDGYQAIEAFKKTRFDLIFMDIKMPGIDGVETFLRIRQLDPKANVIMMTAFALEDQIRRAIQAGAYTVLHKPLDIEKTLSTIEECLASAPLVLIVDDASEQLSTLKSVLEKKGYKTSSAQSGYECLRIIEEKRHDVILLDVRMPGMDGLETLTKIREVRPDATVILMTGYAMENLVHKASELGSVAFLDKPLNVDKVLQTIESCLKNRKP